MADTQALADEIQEFIFGGLNAYGQPARANQLLLDAVVMLRGIASIPPLTPSADLAACRDEAIGPPEYAHPKDGGDA